METDIGNPIEYSPELKHDDEDERDDRGAHEYYHQPPMMYMHPQPPMVQDQGKLDFTNLDKNTYIVMFIAFIIGFFMGKTMQPVILRTS